MPHYDKFLDFHFDIYYQGPVKKWLCVSHSFFLLLTENKNGKITMAKWKDDNDGNYSHDCTALKCEAYI